MYLHSSRQASIDSCWCSQKHLLETEAFCIFGRNVSWHKVMLLFICIFSSVFLAKSSNVDGCHSLYQLDSTTMEDFTLIHKGTGLKWPTVKVCLYWSCFRKLTWRLVRFLELKVVRGLMNEDYPPRRVSDGRGWLLVNHPSECAATWASALTMEGVWAAGEGAWFIREVSDYAKPLYVRDGQN